MENLLELKNINFIHKKNKILSNIDLAIKKNDFITIVGPNGAGKSSLLSIIVGSQKASSGKINKNANLKIGYVPQKISIDNNIPINSYEFLKLCENSDQNLFNEIIKNVKIENLLEKQLNQLSGGEKQKILLAKALINEPDLLILDEPTQNLDISSQVNFYKIINNIYQQRNIAILMVSHDLHIVMSASKKVICLFNHICCSGEASEVSKNSEFISLFGEDMDKILATYSHFHNHKHN